MRHLKKFNRLFESIDTGEINVTGGGPNNNDGGVQIDLVTLEINGTEYHEFELASTIGGESYITYKGGDEGDFKSHFEFEDDKMMKKDIDNPKPSDSYLELFNFIAQLAYDSKDNAEGSEVDIDGFNIVVSDYSHSGGYEFGFLSVEVNDEEFYLDIKQDATGPGLDVSIDYRSDEDEEIATRNGIDIDDEEMQDFFYREYDRISNESR